MTVPLAGLPGILSVDHVGIAVPDLDEAIRLHQPLEDFLAQKKEEATGLAQGYQRLEQILRTVETEN